MKKLLFVISGAIIISLIFCAFLFKGIDKTFAISLDKNEATLFQVGVFKNYENAIICSNEHSGSIIVKSDGLYRVYIGIAMDKEVLMAYKDYFNIHNINYYEKKKIIPDRCIDEIKKYEQLVKKSFDTETYSSINKNLLRYYKDGCND